MTVSVPGFNATSITTNFGDSAVDYLVESGTNATQAVQIRIFNTGGSATSTDIGDTVYLEFEIR